ncbi:MAG: choice-of-anchor B family protein [Bacteroidota bacterium]|nr:choice-of-anchor B family protein [Bacteroidota bacterium]
MKNFILLLSLLFILSFQKSEAQLADKNMYLLKNLNQHYTATQYSAVWGYRAPNGREYAILGCPTGTAFIDITNSADIHEVDFVTGPTSTWREMKTYSNYAYIVSEASNSGVQIVDLQYLPDSVSLVKKFVAPNHSSTHSISQLGPYLYLNGCNSSFVPNGGIVVFDLTADPVTPIVRGKWTVNYVHDCRVVNDTLYAANIYDGKVSIINATNKNLLTTITSFVNLPGSGPHNTALSINGNRLFVTDEIGTAPYKLKVWNIEDLSNITYVTSWQPTGITNSIVHNVEVYGNSALIAHYSAGVRMVNVTNPDTPAEVAWYDTYPLNNSSNYEGCWGVYMFPSGKIIASDRSSGLYVLKTTYNINVAMEGFYNSATNRMNKRDTVRAYLRQVFSPYNIIDSSSAVIDSVTFEGNFKFNNAPSGNYYIAVKHRNCIEVWSKAGGEAYDPMTLQGYDFTGSDTSAFGNNEVQVDASPVKFALYSGDVNYDGLINLNDVISTYNDAAVFTTGYVNTDLTGDNIVNLNDVIINQNNLVNFIGVIFP